MGIVSGFCFLIAAIFFYKLNKNSLWEKNKLSKNERALMEEEHRKIIEKAKSEILTRIPYLKEKIVEYKHKIEEDQLYMRDAPDMYLINYRCLLDLKKELRAWERDKEIIDSGCAMIYLEIEYLRYSRKHRN